MSIIQRRASWLLAAVVMMVLAVPSVAQGYSNPDFPHGDYESDSWVSVNVQKAWPSYESCAETSCSLDGQKRNMDWTQHFGGSYYSSCDVGLEGAIDGEGGIDVSKVPFWDSTGYPQFCYWNPAKAPWTGEICAHLGTEEVWSRMYVTLGGYNLAGDVFGKLVNDNGYSGLWTELSAIDWDNAHFNATPYPIEWDTEIGLSSDVIVSEAFEETEEMPYKPCGWPELS